MITQARHGRTHHLKTPDIGDDRREVKRGGNRGTTTPTFTVESVDVPRMTFSETGAESNGYRTIESIDSGNTEWAAGPLQRRN